MNISDVIPASKRDIHQLKELINLLGATIMSAIQDFALAQQAFNDAQDASMSALKIDIQSMLDQIAKLQASPSVLTPEDQASLDALSAHSKSVSDGLASLDALTKPALPPVA